METILEAGVGAELGTGGLGAELGTGGLGAWGGACAPGCLF